MAVQHFTAPAFTVQLSSL